MKDKFIDNIFLNLNEKIVYDLLINRCSEKLNTKFIEYFSMSISISIVILFFIDLQLFYCLILSVVFYFLINSFLKFWFRNYVEVLIIYNLDLIEMNTQLKEQIKEIYLNDK
jgi:hypothetical protein